MEDMVNKEVKKRVKRRMRNMIEEEESNRAGQRMECKHWTKFNWEGKRDDSDSDRRRGRRSDSDDRRRGRSGDRRRDDSDDRRRGRSGDRRRDDSDDRRRGVSSDREEKERRRREGRSGDRRRSGSPGRRDAPMSMPPPEFYWDGRSNAAGIDMKDWTAGWRENDQEAPEDYVRDMFRKADWNGNKILEQEEFFAAYHELNN